MKRIIIDVPDWAWERNLYFMGGNELFAHIPFGEDKIYYKEIRCNLCGECCKHLAKNAWYFRTEEGTCEHLELKGTEYYCDLASARPNSCSARDPIMNKWPNAEEVCVIRYNDKELIIQE